MANISLIQGESHCETSVMFPQGIPANAGAEVTINGTQLVPSPFVNIVVEKNYVGDYVIGGMWKITLNGTIVGDSFNDVSSQALEILGLGSTGDCLELTIKCTQTFIEKAYGKIVSVSVSEGNNPTWVNIAPYTIELEIYENNGEKVVTPTSDLVLTQSGDAVLKAYSEEFNLSINEDSFSWDEVPGVPALGPNDDNYLNIGNQHVKVTFSMSATGIGTDCVSAVDEYGLAAAEKVIENRINDVQKMFLTNLVPSKVLPPTLSQHLDSYAAGNSYLQFRSIAVNTIENSLSVNGELIYRPSYCKNPEIFTTMTVEENLDNEGRTVTISGNVKGLVDVRSVSSAPSGSYFSIIGLSAAGDWPNCLDRARMGKVHTFINDLTSEDGIKLLKSIANVTEHHPTGNPNIKDTCPAESGFGDDICVSSPAPSSSVEFCELRLISSQISRIYGEGQANFSFVLSNKQNCGIIGARKVDVEITDEYPRDNIVEILIPGRGDKGVLIQNLCCKSATKKGISISATLNSNRCNPQMSNTDFTKMQECLDDYINKLETDEGVNCWFKVEDQRTKGNNTYRLSRQYVKPSCP